MGSGTILIVAFVSLLVGYLAGLVLTRMNTPRPPVQEKDKVVGPRQDVSKLTVALWRKDEKSPIQADIFGKTLRSPDELLPVEKRRLLEDLHTIQVWFGLSKPSPMPAASLAPETHVESIQPVKPPELTVETPDRAQPSAEVLEQTTAPVVVPVEDEMIPPAPVPLPDAKPPLPPIHVTPVFEPSSTEPVKPVEAKLDLRSKPKPEPVMKSIVQQIDDILQDKVARSSLADTGLKLQETPQGVLVWVGNQSYQGVDTLPEGEAKELIHAAVKDWEKRG